MSTGHLWIVGLILLVVLIIWGPGKLPDVGAGMGRAIREFRRATSEHSDPAPPPPAAPAPLAPPAPPVATVESPAPEERTVSS